MGGAHRALIVGTGLIGGSLGLALRQRGWHVTGSDRRAPRARGGLAPERVDEIGDDRDADVVFVAAPQPRAAAVASSPAGAIPGDVPTPS